MSTPKFANQMAWQQAELLMQPAFIRIIDNIRKQLENSAWEGRYHNQLEWPDATSEATKTQVLQLQERLEDASPNEAAEIEQELTQLPKPFPSYQLCLQHEGQERRVDLWQLCYQVCFRNYQPDQDQLVEVDTDLIDETGEVDWLRLDDKVKQRVTQIFQDLPPMVSAQ